jgi:hypothetical protein
VVVVAVMLVRPVEMATRLLLLQAKVITVALDLIPVQILAAAEVVEPVRWVRMVVVVLAEMEQHLLFLEHL